MNHYSRERDNEQHFHQIMNDLAVIKRGLKYNEKWVSDGMVYRECQE